MKMTMRLALACIMALGSLRANAAERINWLGSLNAGIAQAKKANKLVMVDFYSDSCVWCKRLDQSVYPDPRVVSAAKNVVMVKLNVEDGREGTSAATKYNVTKLPTILFLKANGAVVHTSGFMPPKEFAEDMQRASDIHKNLDGWLAKFKKNPNDLANTRQLAKTWLEAGKLAEAERGADIVAKQSPKDKEVARLYIGLGQRHAMDGDTAKAHTLFTKALASAASPMDAASCNYFLGICAMTRRDKASARNYLTKASSTAGAPEGLKKKAKEVLEMLAKS